MTSLAVLGDLALRPMISVLPFILFGLAVALVTWAAGHGPGLVTLVASALLGNVILHPPPGGLSLDTESVVAAGFFLVVGGAIVYLISSRRDAAARLHAEHARRMLVADVGAALDRSLDYEKTLSAVARLMVPRLADWCVVHVLEGTEIKLVAIAHTDPSKIAAGRALAEQHPAVLNADSGLARVLHSGIPELISELDHEQVAWWFASNAIGDKLLELGLRSYMCIPIRRDTTTIGTIGLAMAESGRRYDADDLQLAMSLASRAAIVIDHARLYREAEAERARAEEASHAKDQFLAMLGHELRNPLAPIQTALELMAMQDDRSFSNERTVIKRQVHQLMMLVDDLLDISRITRGKVELHRQPVVLLDVVTKGIEIASPLVESRRHELHVEIDPIAVVEGDPSRLAQVVGNLLTNAAKYSEPGGQIDVRGVRTGEEIVLSVTDRGIGISPDVLPRVFDMFVQAPQAIDRARGGLGLGLAIVRSLVELHGGTVSASSRGTDQGSTFEVRLPALAPPIAIAQPAVSEPRGAHRVLVVDDNIDALAMLADALELRGYETARAHDGPSALALAAKLHPEVALVDIGLPVMDGYELARRLRETDASVKLVALTGYGQPGDFERTSEAGFAAHLVKPVTLARVQATIEQLVA